MRARTDVQVKVFDAETFQNAVCRSDTQGYHAFLYGSDFLGMLNALEEDHITDLANTLHMDLDRLIDRAFEFERKKVEQTTALKADKPVPHSDSQNFVKAGIAGVKGFVRAATQKLI